MDSLFSSERSCMKDISFDYSAEEASPKPNIPRVGRSFLRRGGILEDALEKGVFSRDIEGLFTTLVKEAESKQRSTMCVLGFLDSSFVVMKRAIRRSVIFIFEYILHKINFLNSKMESKCFYKRV